VVRGKLLNVAYLSQLQTHNEAQDFLQHFLHTTPGLVSVLLLAKQDRKQENNNIINHTFTAVSDF
jgi:hypothetical protein